MDLRRLFVLLDILYNLFKIMLMMDLDVIYVVL